MVSHYDAAYYANELAVSDEVYAIMSRLRARKIQPHVRSSDTVFEFGVGSGVNLASLVCSERHGFDVNPTSSAVALRHGVKIIEAYDDQYCAYDVVICHHVLEHLMAPAECLAKLLRVLRPGGTLLLFVPYEEQSRYQTHIASDPNYHLYSWTPHSLANLVIECGFSNQSVGLGSFGYDRIAARLAASLYAGDFGCRILRRCAHLVRKEREVRIVAMRPLIA